MFVCTYGLTNCGAISLSVWPRLVSSRAQKRKVRHLVRLSILTLENAEFNLRFHPYRSDLGIYDDDGLLKRLGPGVTDLRPMGRPGGVEDR